MTQDQEIQKSAQYAAIITAKLGELFQEEEISMEELNEDDNATLFFHALANMVPTAFYNEFTGQGINHLNFNHIANQLCFQYGKRDN